MKRDHNPKEDCISIQEHRTAENIKTTQNSAQFKTYGNISMGKAERNQGAR